MNKTEYAQNQLNRFYIETEYLKETPSYNFIESYSETLLKVITDLKKENVIMDNKLLSLRMDADILNADIPGELYDDYRKGNKRYRENWLIQKKKIDDVTSELYEHLNQLSDL